MKNLFIVKNIETEKVSEWSSRYIIDESAVKEMIKKLDDPEKKLCREKMKKIKNYKDLSLAYQYCVFALKDCGHVEILQTHFIDDKDYMDAIHKGSCTNCVCSWNK